MKVFDPENNSLIMKQLPFFFLLVLFAISCQNETDIELDTVLESRIISTSDNQSFSFFQFPDSDDLDAIPQDPLNPLTQEKVELGRLLFHETAFANEGKFSITQGTYSCATCHHSEAGFQAGLRQGIGEGGHGFGHNGDLRTRNMQCELDLVDVQPIRTPTAMNTAYQELMLWNGQFGSGGLNSGTEAQWTQETPKEFNNLGFQGIETQAIAGMGVHRLKVDQSTVEEYGYKELFDEAFTEVNQEERYNNTTAGLAIAAYERTLFSNQAPFQKYLEGDQAALTDNQKKGAILFFGEAGCVACHSGPALNGMEFHALGMKEFDPSEVFTYNREDPTKFGRYSFTKVESDKYKFKTPQLYNLRDVTFYGHGASFESLTDLLWYKNKGIPENAEMDRQQLADEFKPLGLSHEEILQLEDFILNGLHDPNLERYVPSELPSGNCFPNNDIQSQIDLGCK